jgi:pyridoxal phosphate enzyme (YggS family)
MVGEPMHVSQTQVLDNLSAIRTGIERAAERAARDPAQVLLVAAAKMVPPEAVGWVVEAGVTAVGHNYVKELRAAHRSVAGVSWHFIGTLQTHSAHHVAAFADVVETVAGGNAAVRLARRAAKAGRELDVLIEVDFTGERPGVAPEHVGTVVREVSSLDGVRLRGLMTLPPLGTHEEARGWFRRLRALREQIQQSSPGVVELSMGMSLDYQVAVEEGATMVRIGTALFGPRTT